MKEWIFRCYKIYKTGKKFNADFYLGILNPATAISAKLAGKVSLTFTDTEHATFAKKVTFPFTNKIIVPTCYLGNLGKKKILYNGYHELAYLHPRYFKPDPRILKEIGRNESTPFIIVRFVSWGASHDVGQHGICDKLGFVRELEKYGQILITSERTLPPELERYQVKISPEKMHDLLYYATLYVGEGATMATEAAILGTPSIFISSLAGTMGNFVELENRYHLVYSFNDEKQALKYALSVLDNPNSKERWAIERENFLKDKIDVTSVMIWFIEHYSESVDILKNSSDVRLLV
jgi:predicted glycosyltransferase